MHRKYRAVKAEFEGHTDAEIPLSVKAPQSPQRHELNPLVMFPVALFNSTYPDGAVISVKWILATPCEPSIRLEGVRHPGAEGGHAPDLSGSCEESRLPPAAPIT